MKNLIPWNWGAHRMPIAREDETTGFQSLQREMNRLFDDFMKGTEFPGSMYLADETFGAFTPKLDLKETDREVIVSIETPGMSEKDLDISISDSHLMVRGEKKEEKEENIKGYYRMERTYGSFHRNIPLPCDVDKNKAEALFKHGVVKITLPKIKSAKNDHKKIEVKQA